MNWLISVFLKIMLWITYIIFTLIVEYIDFCDCFLVGFIVWLVCSHGFNLHTGISFLIAIAVVIPLYMLFKNRIGFWIVSVPFSALWSYVFMEFVVKSIFNKSPDTIWSWIIYIGAFLFNIATHQYASCRFNDLEKTSPQRDDEVNNFFDAMLSSDYDIPPTVFTRVWYDPIEGVTKPISEKPANADTPEYRRHVYDVMGQRDVEKYEETRRRTKWQ